MQYLLTAPLIFLLFHSASIFGFTPTGNVLNYNHPINNITPKSKIDQIISLNATNPNNKKLGILSRAVKQYRNKNVLEYLRKNHIHITNRRPLRDVSFWFRAGHIYTSYKLNQASNIVKKRVFKKSYADKKNQTWSQVHETNSQRMIRLCLSLKGFYLKTGQFLGTRHDFMPPHYTRKLSRLHDDLPPLNEHETRKNIEKELNGTIEEYFSYLNLTHPVGCASIAQVHEGVLRKSGQKVAVKIQFPGAEKLMRNDLRNLRKLAEFLQKTDLKIDLLSAIIELQRQIGNEFDFLREARNMEAIHQGLKIRVPEVTVPQPLIVTKRLLVMTFVEGNNLSKIAEFKDKAFFGNKMPRWIKEKFANNLLRVLAKAWGEQIFTLNMFNADPHPGNICISSKGRIGLLDFGQVKSLPLDLLLKFAKAISAIHEDNKHAVVTAFQDLGIKMVNPNDTDMVHKIAVTMLDTRVVPGFSLDPFSNLEALKSNSVTHMPPDLYFLVRTVQMMRGIAYAFDLNFSLADHWAPLAQRVIEKDRLNKTQGTPLW